LNILIVKLGSIGDIVHTIPCLSALRQRFPDARIDWLVESRCRDILLDNPHIDQLLEVDTLRWRRRLFSPATWRQIRASIRGIRSHRYDVVFDFQGLVKSGVCSRLARSPRRIGFGRRHLREPLSSLFTNEHVAAPDGRCHVIDKNLSLLKTVGIETREWSFPIEVPRDLEEQSTEQLAAMELSEFVAINPGGGWPTKRWSSESYGKLAAELDREWNLKSLVFWGPSEEAMAGRVAETSSGAARVAPPTTLRELIAYLKKARLFVGGDTGPFHIAGALGIPVVGLFGPSDPVVNGPMGSDDRVVWKSVPCSPCYKRRCPGYGTVCMTSIEVDEVLDVVRTRLAPKK
jgi:lipopolysaccharide heptosyltransferase I